VGKERVGILSLQGDFSLHRAAFERLGAEVALVKTLEQLASVERIVIPGGESSTIQLLIDRFRMRQALIEFGNEKPIWGTCAGLILLAREVDDPEIRPLGLIDIVARRNAYGRQLDSFISEGTMSVNGDVSSIEMVFIRAPKIVGIGPDVLPIGECRGEVVAALHGKVLVTAFHPELTGQDIVHRLFLSL
jgi:5'-phosphate synthase pdxT subunit